MNQHAFLRKNLLEKNKINLSSERSCHIRSESSQKAEKANKMCSYCNKSDQTRQNVTLRKDLLEELTLKNPTLHGYLKLWSYQM